MVIVDSAICQTVFGKTQPVPQGAYNTPFCIFQAYFEDAAAMGAALQSEIGAKVAADVPNYAPKGAVLCNFPVIEA